MFVDYFAPRPNPTLQHWLQNPHPRHATDRTWEDLDTDCLVNIFQKIDIESMLMFIPLVCKSWHKASLTPELWKCLISPGGTFDPMNFEAYPGKNEGFLFEFFLRRFAREFDIPWSNFTVPKFVKLLIERGKGSAEFLKLPGSICSVTYASTQILNHINKNCKKFKGLHMANARITCNDASALVRCVPKLKFLSLRRTGLSRESLLKILQGCRVLEVLDVRGCTGFNSADVEILEVASHIPNFMCAGAHHVILDFFGLDLKPYDDESDDE